MKLLLPIFLTVSLSIVLSSSNYSLNSITTQKITWSIKVNRDCYLVLNESDYGEIKKDIYVKISLTKGMNNLHFKTEKDGSFILKKIIVVDDTLEKKLDIILPGEIIINDSKNGEEEKKGPRRVTNKCEDYVKELRLKETNKAFIDICVNSKGDVVSAKFVKSDSNSLSQETIDLLLNCAKQFKYEEMPGAPIACGTITIHIGLH